ncbi:MAG: CRTAC1 family protein [Gemmataceae bacterium]
MPSRWSGRAALACVLFAALSCLLLEGCRRRPDGDADEPAGPVWFADVSAEVGLDFRHDAGPTAGYRLPQVIGSGGAFLDVDNDGRLDVYLVQNAGPKSQSRNKLFRQKADGRFEDVSATSGLDIAGYGMGVAVGDIDNDGWVDVYVSQYGGGRLFRNRGAADGRWLGFEEVTRAAGVEQPRWGTSCSFFDYDRDGWLDLVVVNYVDYDPSHGCSSAGGKPDYCHPMLFPGTSLRLFRNLGRDAAGRWRGFEDVTVRAGVTAPGPGLGVLCADLDGDGWPDILVANDAKPNHLWLNQKNGTFVEDALVRGLAISGVGRPQGNMGIAYGDADGDGLADVFITHLTEESHTLWRQGPRGLFQDVTARAHLASPRWRGTGFGTIFADFDHDGQLDLAIVNGRVSRGPPQSAPGLGEFWHPYAERNRLFANEGGGRFRDVSPANPAFSGTPAVSRGLIWGDVDNDGAIDLLVTAVAGPARLYRNVAEKRGRWLMVRAVDPALKRDAHGARVTARAGGRRWVSEVCPGQGYLTSGDQRVHFGLGEVKAIDELRIDWPDGLAETFPAPRLDGLVTVHRGLGRKVER